MDKNLQIDALNMCPPIGAIYAALGIHACVPLSHGASGCCRFQRMEISKHFQKIIRVASCMLSEPAAIFGGRDNFRKAVNNVLNVYAPDLIAVHTTCLSETIGDDMEQLFSSLPEEQRAHVVCANTAGYIGSMLTGYAAMTEAIIRQQVSLSGRQRKKLCVIPGWMNPADLNEIYRYARAFFEEVLLLPDIRHVMDEETPRNVRAYCSGGTKLEDLRRAGECSDIMALGREAAWGAGKALAEISGARLSLLDLPVGITGTDAYIAALAECSDRKVSPEIEYERRRLMDILMKLHPNLYNRTVALFADADLDISLTQYLAEIGMKPQYIAAGFAGEGFVEGVTGIMEKYGIAGKVDPEADRFDMEQHLRDEPTDIMLGGTRGKIISAKLNIPLLRIGFPVCDRSLLYLEPIAGYRGCVRIMRDLLNIFAEEREALLEPEMLPIAESF